MARGGARTGAGRPRKHSNVVGFPGGGASAAPPAAPPAEVLALAEPPADLPPAMRSPERMDALLTPPAEFWRRYAPAAIDQRTLVPATVPGFRELVELAAFTEEAAARLRRFGSEGKPGSERARNYAKLSQRFDAALARFKLTAFGRPADGGGQKKSAANPWAAVAHP